LLYEGISVKPSFFTPDAKSIVFDDMNADETDT